MSKSDGNPLPKGWEIVTLDTVVSELAVGVSVNGEDRPAEANEVGVLRLNAVSNGRFLPNENKFVGPDERGRVAVSPRQRDVLVSRASGSLEQVGACVYVESNYPNLFLPDLLWRLTTDHNENCSRWLHYALSSPFGRRAIVAKVAGSNGTHKISQTNFRGISVLRPPLAEQKRIAAILSTWDRAIELTENLIAAKQQRKDALMQRLLTGKVRLPGFRDTHWKACELGDVASNSARRIGTTTPPPVYSVTNSVGMVPMDESVVGASIDRYKAVAKYDFAYNPMRINVGSIAMWEGDDEVLVSPDYVVFRCAPDLDPEFLNHYRTSHQWDQFVTKAGGGSVRVRIYFSDLAELPLKLPPVEEQKAIAAVLNTQDREIGLLQKKLDALRRQKKGLMQQLLTGKVRVNS